MKKQFNDWELDDGRVIRLLKPNEVKALPKGVKLISINGEIKTSGVDVIDLDTRQGYTAWGTPVTE